MGKGELAAVRARSFLVSLVVLIQASWSSPSWGWVLEGHHSITLDALAVLPPAMREALTPHVSVLLAGVVEPDFHRVVSHKIPIISLSGTPPPARSGAPNEFQRLATNAQEMLRLGRDLSEVSFVLGQATHFVQDLNQPLHAAWGETRAEHNEIEAQMLYRSWQKDHTYRGSVHTQSPCINTVIYGDILAPEIRVAARVSNFGEATEFFTLSDLTLTK